MAIEIECLQCHQKYRVADGLMGKKVKCRNCGTPIDVRAAAESLELMPDEAPGGGALTRLAETNLGVPSLPALESTPDPTCPQCNATLPRGAKICINCGWGVEGGGARPADDSAEEDQGLTNLMKNRRWVRRRGSRSLENLDELLKYLLSFMGLAGVIVWGVRVGLSPVGFTLQGLLPILVVLGLVVLLIAPVVAWAVNKAVVLMKLAPRDDMYMRVLAVLLLPLSTSMIAGCPGLDGQLDGAVTVSWVLAPLLLVYFLRADLLEWVVSMGVAAGALLAGFLLTGVGASAISMAAGPLNRDVLPKGPWMSLATGHSPVPVPLPPKPVTPGTQPPVAATSAPPGATGVPETQSAAISSESAVPLPPPPPQPPTEGKAAPVAPGATPSAVQGSSGEAAMAPPLPVPLVQSALLRDIVTDHPSMLNVSEMTSASQASYVLLSRSVDSTTSSVERWSVAPFEKHGEAIFQQLPQRQNQYLLSPKGDWLVALTVFPRYQLQFYNFDTKTTKKAVPLEQGQGQTPQLVGFVDQNQFLIRDAGDLYYFNLVSGKPVRMRLESPPAEGSPIAISRNGKYIAMFTQDQRIAIYSVDYPAALPRKISPANVSLKCVNLVFSPDNAQIAVYGVVSDMPSILAFKVSNGELISTALVPPEEGSASAEKAGIRHDLLWLGSGQTWILNGRYVVDTATGRRLGVMEVPNLLDQLSVGTPMGESLLFIVQGEDKKRRLVIATLDDAKLRAVRERLP